MTTISNKIFCDATGQLGFVERDTLIVIDEG